MFCLISDLKCRKLRPHIEARTSLIRIELSVSHDPDLAMQVMQTIDQSFQTLTLRTSPSILGTTHGIQSTLIADPQTPIVIPSDMSPGDIHAPGEIDTPLHGDVEVITYTVKSPRSVIPVELREDITPVLSRRTTVDDDHIDDTLRSLKLRWQDFPRLCLHRHRRD